jgi:chorismate mutase
MFSSSEVAELHELNEKLPITIHNKEQNAIKKRWIQGYNEKLDKIFADRIKNEVGDFRFDTAKSRRWQ